MQLNDCRSPWADRLPLARQAETVILKKHTRQAKCTSDEQKERAQEQMKHINQFQWQLTTEADVYYNLTHKQDITHWQCAMGIFMEEIKWEK